MEASLQTPRRFGREWKRDALSTRDCWRGGLSELSGSEYRFHSSMFFSGLEADTCVSIGLEESVRRDVTLVKEWKFLPQMADVLGYVYETETGRLRAVE